MLFHVRLLSTEFRAKFNVSVLVDIPSREVSLGCTHREGCRKIENMLLIWKDKKVFGLEKVIIFSVFDFVCLLQLSLH